MAMASRSSGSMIPIGAIDLLCQSALVFVFFPGPFGGGVIGNTPGSGPVIGGSSPPPRANVTPGIVTSICGPVV